MINPRDIEIQDYNYDLPDERIAKYPLAERNQSKLLIYRGGQIEESQFFHLPELIPAGALMVFNNTRVIQARLHFHKETGALIEVFCLEPEAPRDYAQNFAAEGQCDWICLVGNSKKWKEGTLTQTVTVDGQEVELHCERIAQRGTSQHIRFSWEARGVRFADILDAIGELPIPPYLNRATEESDKTTYQTVYSRIKGSVAAPTAGLHFTDTELDKLREKRVDLEELTLHVGAGTFKPVKSERIEGHEMHTEFIDVPRRVIERLIAQLQKPTDNLIAAVGTTSVRTVESLYYIGVKLAENPEAHPDDLIVHQWEPYDRGYSLSTVEALQHILAYLDRHQAPSLVTATQILIAPGFPYRVVRAIVTNFHMPQSTLLLLVSAFVDTPETASSAASEWRRIYRYALDYGFRFLSYGDSSILFRE
jgi:S-adenosylmethionine:tRNA ribosyltransferase-isomerase